MITFRRRPEFADDDLGDLLEPDTPPADRQDYELLLSHSLAWIGAYDGMELIGYANLAWDGGVHAFLLDPTVRPDYRGRGIGTRLVREALAAAAEHPKLEWVHVDASADLMKRFYEPAGFRPTPAGLVRVDDVRQGRLT
jgi:ribosomal protein S18 acetylase RimI-like enzyme